VWTACPALDHDEWVYQVPHDEAIFLVFDSSGTLQALDGSRAQYDRASHCLAYPEAAWRRGAADAFVIAVAQPRRRRLRS
jgi:hypothetical protein